MPPFSLIPLKLVEKYVMKLRRQLGDDTLVEQFMGKVVDKLTNRTLPLKPAQPITIITRGKRFVRKLTTPHHRRSKGNVKEQKRRYKQRRKIKTRRY